MCVSMFLAFRREVLKPSYSSSLVGREDVLQVPQTFRGRAEARTEPAQHPQVYPSTCHLRSPVLTSWTPGSSPSHLGPASPCFSRLFCEKVGISDPGNRGELRDRHQSAVCPGRSVSVFPVME